MWWGLATAWISIIPPCTMLDQTVNQIRLLCAIGSREAISFSHIVLLWAAHMISICKGAWVRLMTG